MSLEFVWEEEHEELRRAIRDFCSAESPESEVRRVMETLEGYDPRVWERLTGQLALTALPIPEKYGGAGYGPVELLVAFEELGRALACVPYFATVGLAANALLASGDETAMGDFLPGIASGETIATLAVPEESGSWDVADVQLPARRSAGDTWVLSGVKSYVLDGTTAGLVLVAARTVGGVSLFAVDGDATGLRREPLSTMDQTRRQARLHFQDVPARLVGAEGAGQQTLGRALDAAAAALAAEQVGGAQHVLDTTVEYAKTRMQFGRAIGSFQSIKHRCADMLLEVESARSAAYHAGWAAADDPDELPLAAALAKSYCSDVFVKAAADSVQTHGGIGFTWEHPAHLYFKRAVADRALLGSPDSHRQRLAGLVGL